MIRTDSDEYFIEPLERGTQELEDQGRVHVVYRRSALLKAAPDASVDYQPAGRFSRVASNYKSIHYLVACSSENHPQCDVTTGKDTDIVIASCL